VACGDRLSLVDQAFRDALKAREIDGAIAKPDTSFTVGQQIRLAGGPFDGLIGTIIELGEKERLTVLMSLLNGLVKVHVKPRWASPVTSAAS
jgi:transcriptional antiterminator RfaH